MEGQLYSERVRTGVKYMVRRTRSSIADIAEIVEAPGLVEEGRLVPLVPQVDDWEIAVPGVAIALLRRGEDRRTHQQHRRSGDAAKGGHHCLL